MKNNNTKPLTIVHKEFIDKLTDMVNNSGLPPFVLEPIFRDFHSQIKTAKNTQLENDLKLYYGAEKAKNSDIK